MKQFIPVSDELLFSDADLKRYRLVPYNPDFIHLRGRQAPTGREQPPRNDRERNHGYR